MLATGDAAFDDESATAPAPMAAAADDRLHRLPLDWDLPAASSRRIASAPVVADVEFSWARESIRHVGTLVHRVLQGMAGDRADAWTAERVRALAPVYRDALRQLGVPAAELETAGHRALDALCNVLADRRGHWLLFERHTDARSEYALSGELDGAWRHFVLDRTFVDAEGWRWIVDYKTSSHEGADLEGFLDNESERYRKQLQDYARLFARLDARPIRLGLYFPLLRAWRAWDYRPSAEAAPGA